MTKGQQQDQRSVHFGMRCLFLLLLAGVVTASEPLTITSTAWSFTAAEGWDVWWQTAPSPSPSPSSGSRTACA